MTEAICPSCAAPVTVKGVPKIGLTVTCGSCDTELEVVWLDPLELDWPMDEADADLDDDFEDVEAD
jgi:lysine biosynthesis protein LysW